MNILLNNTTHSFAVRVGMIFLGFLISLPLHAMQERLVEDRQKGDRQPVEGRKTASGDGFVQIKVLRGKVRVSGWDKKEILVRGLLDEEVRQFVFEVDGKNARIEVKIPRKNDGWTTEGSALEIHIPKDSNLDIISISTDVHVANVLGGLEVDSVSGDMIVADVKDRIDLKSVSGEVELRNVKGKLHVSTISGDIEAYKAGGGSFETVSGEIRLDEIGEELNLQSVSGDIEVNGQSYSQIKGHSISGDIEITGELKAAGVIEFDNVSGSIRLELPGDTDASFDIKSGSGGSIRNRLTDDKPRVSKYVRNESLKFIMGKGRGEVILGTFSGDITLTH